MLQSDNYKNMKAADNDLFSKDNKILPVARKYMHPEKTEFLP